MSHRRSGLWYWMLLFLPSLAVLLVILRESSFGVLLTIFALAAIRVGYGQFGPKALGELTLVAAVGVVLYHYVSFYWMYPPTPSGEMIDESLLTPKMLVSDQRLQASFAVWSCLFLAARPTSYGIRATIPSVTLFVLLVYPVIGYWAWGNSSLDDPSFRDFSGGTVVYAAAGWSSLFLAIVDRQRLSSDQPIMEPTKRQRWSYAFGVLLLVVPLALLWFQSAPPETVSFGVDDPMILGKVNACLAAVAGMFSAALFGRILLGTPTMRNCLVGFLASTASIASLAIDVTNLHALALGTVPAILAILLLGALTRTVQREHIEFPVALSVGGTFGALCVAYYPLGDLRQQMIGIAFCIVLSMSLGLLGLVFRLRPIS